MPIVFLLFAACFIPLAALAQTTGGVERLRVYLDCEDCYAEFIRDETRWVDFVREPQAADIHILVTENETGSGGIEYAVRFAGQGRFVATDETLLAVSPSGETDDHRRRAILRTVTIGLANHAARHGLADDLTVAVAEAQSRGPVKPLIDRWDLWVFSLRVDGTVEAEESRRQTTLESSVSADRVSQNWRISLGGELERDTETFHRDAGDSIVSRRRDTQVNWLVVKSLGEHWSAGVRGTLRSSTFGNEKIRLSTAPAVEYNLFPYSQYSRRQLRFQYSIGPRYQRYNEVTIFDKTRERLLEHQLSSTIEHRERWGTLEASLAWSQYLHDLSKNRLEGESEVSLRIARGLSATLEGNVSRIRDQLSLPKRNVTPEELLLRLRELQSTYEISVQIGLTYTFGSLFNNIVNPRFGE